jgi:hypothetical protein
MSSSKNISSVDQTSSANMFNLFWHFAVLNAEECHERIITLFGYFPSFNKSLRLIISARVFRVVGFRQCCPVKWFLLILFGLDKLGFVVAVRITVSPLTFLACKVLV